LLKTVSYCDNCPGWSPPCAIQQRAIEARLAGHQCLTRLQRAQESRMGWVDLMEEAAYQGRAGVEAAARFIRQTWEAA
jgi:hypothetical protein